MTQSSSHFDRIKQRLADSSKPRPSMEPCLSEAEIMELEQRLRTTLPEEYRLFLKEIGNGGHLPSLAGLLTGIFSLLPDEISDYRPDKPFPLTEGWLWAGGDEDRETQMDEAETSLKYTCSHDGQLPLCDQGHDEIWTLITMGPERGNMWLVTESGAAPTTPRCGFLDWFEAWMDRQLDAFNLVAYDTHGETIGD